MATGGGGAGSTTPHTPTTAEVVEQLATQNAGMVQMRRMLEELRESIETGDVGKVKLQLDVLAALMKAAQQAVQGEQLRQQNISETKGIEEIKEQLKCEIRSGIDKMLELQDLVLAMDAGVAGGRQPHDHSAKGDGAKDYPGPENFENLLAKSIESGAQTRTEGAESSGARSSDYFDGYFSHCLRWGHKQVTCREKAAGRVCYNCRKTGHKANECSLAPSGKGKDLGALEQWQDEMLATERRQRDEEE